MILAPVPDFRFQSVVRRAALPEEDVFHEPGLVLQALQFGYPRVFLVRTWDWGRFRVHLKSAPEVVPVLSVGDGSVVLPGAGRDLKEYIGESAVRLRAVISESAEGDDWVEGFFSDLTRILGQRLPLELRGFFRRVLEFPAHYGSLRNTGERYGLSHGALKARFRRRQLPSPSTYLRWLRVLAAARILSTPEEKILGASHRLGFASDGNFCRWVSSVSGLTPSSLRDWDNRLNLLIRLAEECFPPGALESWRSFRGLFVRSVA